jgi:chromosomal replication initiator protein
MRLTTQEAQERIEELRSTNEAAADLALLASLAARIEPELLRRLRLETLPTAGAETEADLWFSGVVAAKSTSWAVLVPEVAELLRTACRGRFDERHQRIARDAIRWAHASASSLVLLEDEIHWHTMRGEQEAIEQKLVAIVEALRSDDGLPVAQWALRALPRFSTTVRELPGAWVIRLVAEQQLGFPMRLEPGQERVPAEVWPLLRGAMPSTEIFARLVEGGAELSRDPLIGGHRLTTPLTEPVVVQVSSSRPLRVFISSTHLDLTEHRQAAMDAAASLGLSPVVGRLPDTIAGSAVDAALREIDGADVYIGILGHRYSGIRADPAPNAEGLSIIEIEYQRAFRRGIPIFMYLMNDEHPVTLSDIEMVEPYRAKLEALKTEARSRSLTREFSSVEELKGLVLQALAPLEARQRLDLVVPHDSTVYAPTPHPVEIRTIDGTRHTLSATSPDVRDGVTLRFLLLGGIKDAASLARLFQFTERADLIFVAGGIVARGLEDPSTRARRFVDGMIEARAASRSTFFLAVADSSDPGTSAGLGDLGPFAAFVEELPRPSATVQSLMGDYATTIEIDGARIGIVGLILPREGPFIDFSQERLRAICGPDPEVWARGHHFTILLTSAPTSDLSIQAYNLIGPLFSLHLHGPVHPNGLGTDHSLREVASSTLPGGRLTIGIAAAPLSDADRVQRLIEVEVRIGDVTKLTVRHADPSGRSPRWRTVGHRTIPTPALSQSRDAPHPEMWILVAGSARDLSRRTRDTARAIGASLCLAGYGLMTGGWPGVDEEVTRGFAAALGGSTDRAQEAIRHYVGALEPTATMPGRRLFFGSDRDAVIKSVEEAAAVVLIAGADGTAWIGEEAAARRKPLIPVPATAGAAARFGELSERALPPALTRPESLPAERSDAVLREITARRRDAESANPSMAKFNPPYRFETFAVSDANRLAYTASRSVAENPGASFNPLFLYGGPGLGKTHLLQAIGQQIRSDRPEMKIVYTTAEAFADDVTHSIRYDHITEFRERYRTADLLLVDDVQFLSDRDHVQEEFFYLFNTLHNAQKQMAFTADAAPRALPGLAERLRACFEGGLIAYLTFPDLDGRISVVRAKAAERRTEVAPEVALLLAQRARSNIRELQGLFNRVLIYASMADRPLTLDLALETLKDLLPGQRPLSPEKVFREVAKYFGVKPAALKAKTAILEVVYPRQVAMYLCSELIGLSVLEICAIFGRRPPSLVTDAIESVRALVRDDRQVTATIAELVSRLV